MNAALQATLDSNARIATELAAMRRERDELRALLREIYKSDAVLGESLNLRVLNALYRTLPAAGRDILPAGFDERR